MKKRLALRRPQQFIDGRHPNLPKDIASKRELTAEIKTALNQALTEFKDTFATAAEAA